MADVKEITITCKNEERSMKYKHLVYDRFEWELDDPVLQELREITVKQFGDPDCEVKLRGIMVM